MEAREAREGRVRRKKKGRSDWKGKARGEERAIGRKARRRKRRMEVANRKNKNVGKREKDEGKREAATAWQAASRRTAASRLVIPTAATPSRPPIPHPRLFDYGTPCQTQPLLTNIPPTLFHHLRPPVFLKSQTPFSLLPLQFLSYFEIATASPV